MRGRCIAAGVSRLGRALRGRTGLWPGLRIWLGLWLGLSLSTLANSAVIDPLSARFRHVDYRRGLSQDTVLAMAQDRDNTVWIGTQDGLNHFDGYEVTTYRAQSSDPHALASTWVAALAFDAENQLWAGGTGGLSRYDRQRDRFDVFQPFLQSRGGLGGSAVFALHRDAAGRLWVGGDGGLALWRPEQQRFEVHAQPQPFEGEGPGANNELRIRALCDDGNGGLWLATIDGLLHFDPAKTRFSQPEAAAAVTGSLTALLRDTRGRLWIGSEREGLWQLDDVRRPDSLRRWQHRPDRVASLSHNRVLALLEDSQGAIWIGTGAGADRLDEAAVGNARFLRYSHVRHDAESLGRGAVASLLQDRDGSIWMGTWSGGASILSGVHNRMLSLHPDVIISAAMRSASVRSVAAHEQGFWLGSEDGVYRLIIDPLLLQLLPGTENLFVFDMHYDAAGQRLWLGSESGLRVYDLRSNRLQVPTAPDEVTRARVRRVLRDGERTWVALMPEGIHVFSAESGRSEQRFAIAGLVAFIEPLDEHTVLVGAQDGLYWFSRDGSALIHRHGLGEGTGSRRLPGGASAFLRGADGQLWLGTSGGGLVKLIWSTGEAPATARFEAFDQRQGLASNLLGKLLQDDQGRIWVSTIAGLSRFDPDSQRFRNFVFGDGTLGRSYWIGAGARTESGDMAFGGTSGLTLFDPAAIQPQQAPASPRITGLSVDHDRGEFGPGDEDRAELAARLQVLAEGGWRISAADAHALSFRFSSTEFLAPQHLRYQYRLDGFDRNWREVGAAQRIATYTNLAPGNYLFRVRARNVDGLFSDSEARAALQVDPLWWQRGWVQALAALVLVAAVVAALRRRMRFQQRQKAKLERQVKERTADIAKLGEIAKELTATLDIEQAMDRVYQQVSARLDAHVFAISFYDPKLECLREAYVREAGVRETGLELSMAEHDRPAVWCVLQRRELIVDSSEELLKYVQVNLPPMQGGETESIVYLPLIVGERMIGCLTVQSLQRRAYHPNQIEFMRVLAGYTAIALDNALRYAELDTTVAQRTADIIALGEIGRELTATLDAEEAMSRVHHHVSAVLDAYVFSIGVYDPQLRVIRRDYAVEDGRRLPQIEYSLDEADRPAVWCVREGRELITRSTAELRQYVSAVLTPKAGILTESIVYLPLRYEGRVRGFLSVQSPKPNAYSKAQLEFLRVLGSYTAIALENARNYARLDQAVAERTAELRVTVSELRAAQQNLIEREKMASLGGLVAGVAHEVNTPIGIAVTAASHLDIESRRLAELAAGGRLTKSALQTFCASSEEGLRLVLTSLDRAHQLIGSFKQVAVDQSSEQRRRFDLRTTLEEILFSLRPSYRRGNHEIDLDCPEGIEMETYPGALFQIITNLMTNSITHGFADQRVGRIVIQASLDGEQVQLRYLDNGLGMTAQVASHAFEPFFTTRRGSGGSGLGLHLVYNLATRLLGGDIRLQSEPGQGVEFVLLFPRCSRQVAAGETAASSS